MPRTLLIAGCGQLGTEAGLALADHGCAIHGLRRHPDRLPSPIHGIAADLARPDLGLRDPLPKADILLYILSADAFDDTAYRRAYVDGLRHLLHTLRSQDTLPRRLVYVSSTSVYAQQDGSWVDENAPTEPTAFSGQRLLEGEALARDADVPETTIIRFAGIYGPTRTFLLRSVADGRAVCFDQPPIWTNRIHSSDAAAALVHLALAPEITPTYIGVDDQPAPDGEVKRWLADRLGAPAPPAAHDLPPDREKPQLRNRRRSNKRCSNKLLRDSGFRFRYPTYREGYGAIIDARPSTPRP